MSVCRGYIRLCVTFFDELATGVLDTRWTRLAAAGRVRAVPALLVVVALEGIGHGDQGVYDFRCPWRDLGRRDTEKTRGSPSRRAGIHVHVHVDVEIIHGDGARGDGAVGGGALTI